MEAAYSVSETGACSLQLESRRMDVEEIYQRISSKAALAVNHFPIPSRPAQAVRSAQTRVRANVPTLTEQGDKGIPHWSAQ